MAKFTYTAEFPLMLASMRWEKLIHPNFYNYEVNTDQPNNDGAKRLPQIFNLQSSILFTSPPGSHNTGYETKQVAAPTDARNENQ